MREIQEAVYSALTGNVRMMAAVTGVYDNPAQANDSGSGSVFPYLTIGQMTVQPFDDDTSTGYDAEFIVHAWARDGGYIATADIQRRVYDALHRRDLAAAGYQFLGCDLLSQDAEKDPDGVTVHGIQRFRVVVLFVPVLLLTSDLLNVMTSDGQYVGATL